MTLQANVISKSCEVFEHVEVLASIRSFASNCRSGSHLWVVIAKLCGSALKPTAPSVSLGVACVATYAKNVFIPSLLFIKLTLLLCLIIFCSVFQQNV